MMQTTEGSLHCQCYSRVFFFVFFLFLFGLLIYEFHWRLMGINKRAKSAAAVPFRIHSGSSLHRLVSFSAFSEIKRTS